jgi:hypothetical protein
MAVFWLFMAFPATRFLCAVFFPASGGWGDPSEAFGAPFVGAPLTEMTIGARVFFTFVHNTAMPFMAFGGSRLLR